MEFVLSFLPTKEDYVNYKACVLKNEAVKKDYYLFLAAGILVISAGILNIVLKEITIGALYIAIGAFLCFYFKHFYPLIVKNKAASYFENHKEKFTSVSYILREYDFEIKSDRYSLKCPYDMLYKIKEDEKCVLLYIGEGEINYIPKRILREEEKEFIRSLGEKR